MKAKLILDEMPDSCWYCDLQNIGQRGQEYCFVIGCVCEDDSDYRRPKWCPLREVEDGD